MKQYYLILLFFVVAIQSVVAQTDIRQKGDADNSEYPEIKFQINHYNPSIKSKDAFKLFENENELQFEMKHIEPGKDEIHKNKTILILFEDMNPATHPGQKTFFQDMLSVSLAAFVKQGDAVNVGIFNRSTDGSSPIRNFLLQNYTDDTELLKGKINGFKSNYDLWASQKSTDLYQAVYDGINELVKIDTNTGKILVVLSAGFNNPESSENSTARAINLAHKNRIPVYSIQYYYQGWEHHKLTTLVEETNGKEYIASHRNRKEEVQIAADSLATFMNNALRRLHGNDYEFTFETSEERDNKAHVVQLKEGSVVTDIAFYTPNPSVIDIVKNNLTLTIILLIALIAIILVILYINKRKKEAIARKEKEQQERVEKLRIEAERREIEQKEREEEDRRKMEELQREVDEQRRKAEEQHRRAEEDKQRKMEQLKREASEKELEQTIKEMKIKGFPRLIITTKEGNKTLSVTNPETTLGRDDSNMIVLDEQSVSRNHARLFYQKGDYFIEDLGSSNGTMVNGRKAKKHRLNNADVIQLGNQQISFFLSR